MPSPLSLFVAATAAAAAFAATADSGSTVTKMKDSGMMRTVKHGADLHDELAINTIIRQLETL